MAYKLPWGSFSTEDLVVDKKDDIYETFPFLSLVELKMVSKYELRISDNAVRGIKDVVNPKIVGLSGSLCKGWDRTSWPVPYMIVKGEKEAFDRRHTVKVVRGIVVADEVPGSEYERCSPSYGGVFNDFLDESILTMAAMWGNVYGPIVEDTKDYMFETACVRIIKIENGRHDEDLLTRKFIRKLLEYMGCYSRYNDNKVVVERIVTKVLDALRDPEKVVGQLTKNNNEEDVDRFIKKSKEWQPHNTENDTNIFIVQQIRDVDTFAQTWAEKILTKVCDNEKKFPKKVTKILLWNKEDSNKAQKVVSSRIRFKEKINHSWRVRRDNILEPVEKIINKVIVDDNCRKRLSDLKMEIWVMNQLEDEDEVFEMAFDTEE
jgi:hypothetical protein